MRQSAPELDEDFRGMLDRMEAECQVVRVKKPVFAVPAGLALIIKPGLLTDRLGAGCIVLLLVLSAPCALRQRRAAKVLGKEDSRTGIEEAEPA